MAACATLAAVAAAPAAGAARRDGAARSLRSAPLAFRRVGTRPRPGLSGRHTRPCRCKLTGNGPGDQGGDTSQRAPMGGGPARDAEAGAAKEPKDDVHEGSFGEQGASAMPPDQPSAAAPDQQPQEKEGAASNGQQQSTGLGLSGFKVQPIWTNKANEAGVNFVPKDEVEVLRNQVFGFDTFFVTSQEPYEGGVLFQGNLRGSPTTAFAKIETRLQERLPGKYALFLLVSPDSGKPVAVVTPKESVTATSGPIPEWVAAGAFGFTALLTIVLRTTSLEFDSLGSTEDLTGLLLEGLPSTFMLLACLGAHEAGHWYAARRVGAKISVPFFIPSLQLGSFGGITRVKSILRNRQQLGEIAAGGPLAGGALALLVVVLGFVLPAVGDQAVAVDSSAFHDSFIIGGIAKLLLGDRLAEGGKVDLNPVTLAAWTGLLINAINAIPVGELDGGRVALALWGRKVAARVNGLSLALLGLTAIFNDISLYWVVLVIFLQRGPITPQANELEPPSNTSKAVGVAALIFGLFVYLPYPIPFS
eukprot:SM000080S22917  [mRNA]  locus=s80:116460:120020:+ [translate_table: standard]